MKESVRVRACNESSETSLSVAPMLESNDESDSSVVVSSMLKDAVVVLITRMLKPDARTVSASASASGQVKEIVSKKPDDRIENPAVFIAEEAREASWLIRRAIRCSPSGPCHTPYMPAIFASKTCAVQILDVAFSRRMCCSRVCNVRRNAGRPAVSVLTPTSRPGSDRACLSRVAIKAA